MLVDDRAGIGLLILLGVELLLSDRAGISNDVARERAVGIGALGTLGNVDAGEQVDVLLDVGDGGAPHIGGNGMGTLRALGVVLDVAQDGHIGHAEHVGEMPNRDRIIRKVAVRRDGK